MVKLLLRCLLKHCYSVALVNTASSLKEMVKPVPYYCYISVDIGVNVIDVNIEKTEVILSKLKWSGEG